MVKGYSSRASNSLQENKNQSGNGNGLVVTDGSRATILLILLFLVFLLGAIWSIPPPPVECVTMTEALAHISMQRPDKTFSFIDNQVIVTGPASAFRQVLDGLKLELIKKCDINYLDTALDHDETQQRLPYFGGVSGKLTTRLYHIRSEESVAAMVQEINSRGHNLNLQVYADPNLLTGHSVCGNPDVSGGGSPFGGVPELLPVGEEESVKLFWDQWAFRQVGVGWWFKRELAGAAAMHQGDGVLVGVFDTSPFPDPWNDRPGGRLNTSPVPNLQSGLGRRGRVPTIITYEIVKWVNPAMDVEPLTLKVSYPRMTRTVATRDIPSRITNHVEVGDVRDHGLFVAGLIHAVAPGSEIRLVRVLDEIGCGTIFTLNEALLRFIGEVERERKHLNRKDLNGVIINLSLGIRNKEDSTVSAQQAPSPDVCKFGDRGYEIELLCATLFDAHRKGAVIVAAAGNESNGEDDPPEAQIPAVYEFVIGVEANDQLGDLACFSNKGDVRAPGGDGGHNPTYPKDPCAPVVDKCVDEFNLTHTDCFTGVIGPVLFPPEGSAYWPTHYGYWSGTSFATPLVSGLTALVLQAEGVPDNMNIPFAVGSSNQNLVTTTIQCSAVVTPAGVINVPAALTDDCLP